MYYTQRLWKWLKSSNEQRKNQGRLQDDLDCSFDDLAAATKEFSDCWEAHEATGVKL